MITLNPRYEVIFDPRNIYEDCDKIADEINDVARMQIKEILVVGMYKQAVTLYLQLLKSMVNHFVDDEHFCFFDDMYSPEYSLQWIYENIMKYFKVNAIRNMGIRAISIDNLGRVFYSLNEGLRI